MISSYFSLVFRISVHHIEYAILNFENLMADLDSATPKTYVRTISPSSEHFSKSSPPYWIRHSEFWKFDGRFGFNYPKNLWRANFIEFCTFFKILNTYWIRHFKIWKFNGRFGFSGPKNLYTDNFIEFWTIFKIFTTILDLPFWIF